MLQHEHFGKIRPHKHTSYAGLFFILLLAGVLLLGISYSTDAAQPVVNPQSGSIGLTGRVPGPPPSTSATILSPSNGSHTSTIPITISGACTAGDFVNIFKNNVFGGAAVCQGDGTFSLLVDLFDGSNSLVAKLADALGQYGPDSSVVTVFYDAPSLSIPGGAVGRQLFIESTSTTAGVSPGVSLTRNATIVGGNGPYAVSWDWGDDATSLSTQLSEGQISASHVYEQPGTYRVILRVTDSLGNSAFLQMVTVVNGPVESFGTTNGNGLSSIPGALIAAWPLYILAGFMVLFFFIGERIEIRKLRHQNALVAE